MEARSTWKHDAYREEIDNDEAPQKGTPSGTTEGDRGQTGAEKPRTRQDNDRFAEPSSGIRSRSDGQSTQPGDAPTHDQRACRPQRTDRLGPLGSGPPRTCYVVHGEWDASESLRDAIRSDIGCRAVVPQLDEIVFVTG